MPSFIHETDPKMHVKRFGNIAPFLLLCVNFLQIN